MKTNYLLPASFKKFGWFILFPSVILGLFTVVGDWEPSFLDVNVPAIFLDDFTGNRAFVGVIENNILNEICGILIILSGIMVAFSKEKMEDEYIASLRLKSLVWATYVNYLVLILALLFVYEFSFFWVMVFNMFTILLFFIVKFNWSIKQLQKAVSYEE